VEPFDQANRCPKCDGQATTKYHGPAQGCYEALEAHMHRQCRDCGLSWMESPPASPPRG
jgi:hypothetical protein